MRFGTILGISAVLVAQAGSARAEEWLQRYHDAQHTSFINSPVDPLGRVTFEYIFDPTQVTVGLGDILVHYTDPKLRSNGDIYTPFRDKVGNNITYSVKKIHNGRLAWTFESDYVRFPSGAWEPVFDFAINDTVVYVAGAYGCIWMLDDATGMVIANACPYSPPANQTGLAIYITSPLTIDLNGNVYWTIRTGANPLNVRSEVVKLAPDGVTVNWADFATLTGDPAQIAAMNAAPAVSADGSTVYVASTLPTQLDGHLLALDQDLNPIWDSSLRVDIPAGQPMGPCHEARLNDSGTSSPIALPDGGAAIGGWNFPNSPGCNAAECPVSEGFYYSFDSRGTLRGCYPFGWDDTMGIITLNGTTYLVGKHNHYTANPPRYEIVLLNAATMQKVWSFFEPANPTNEWCISAPTLFKTADAAGNETGYVVGQSEGGPLFRVRLLSNPPEFTSVPVGTHQNAAYVPTVSVGGTAYTQNHGRLVGVSRTPPP